MGSTVLCSLLFECGHILSYNFAQLAKRIVGPILSTVFCTVQRECTKMNRSKLFYNVILFKYFRKSCWFLHKALPFWQTK